MNTKSIGVIAIIFASLMWAIEPVFAKLAYQLNSNHGLQLSSGEKKKYTQEMISEMTIDELSEVLSVSK